MTYLLFLIFLGLLSFHFYIRYRRKGRLACMVPGPAPYPFIGNMLHFDTSSYESTWRELRRLSGTYYPITRVWCFASAVFVTRHPDDVEVILSSSKAIEKAWIYQYFHPWLKTGLLTSAGEKWKQRRKILTSAFHFNIINKYMIITEEQGEIFIKNLRAEGKATIKSLIPLCSNITLNIICESAMGVALDKMETTIIEKYKNAIYEFGKIIAFRVTKPYLLDWMFKLAPFWNIARTMNNSLPILHQFTDKVVKERKQYHANTEYEYLQGFTDDVDEFVDIRFSGRKKRMAMLDLLLSAERDGIIDEEGIKEEVDTFTFEGHDTSAMAMTYILMILAENKEVQNKARAEVTKLVNENNGKFDIKHINECQYLERCIKETLRLYPPVPMIFRRTADDIELQLKHALLPCGTHVLLQIYDLHRDPNFWPDPEKFDPDRFLPEQSKGRHPFAYIPFSAGSRNCIGQKFAMNELKSLTGRILYNFHLEPVDRLADIQMIADMILRPNKPLHLKFVRIDDN